MKTLVFYGTKYGAAKRYAIWIADALGAQWNDCKADVPATLDDFDTVVFGGSLYAGMVRGRRALLKRKEQLKGKKLILFTVGLTDPADEERLEEIRRMNFPAELLEQAEVFHFRGRVETGKLQGIDRMILKMVKRVSKSKSAEEQTPEQAAMAAMLSGDADYMEQEAIRPLLEAVRGESVRVNAR